MQNIISQIPQLSIYLTKIPKQNHHSTIKQIILAGLKTIRPSCCKQNHTKNDNINHEINRIKENLQQLNHMVKSQCHHCCNHYYPKDSYINQQHEPHSDYRHQALEQNASKTFSFKPTSQKKMRYEPPVKETLQHHINHFLNNKQTVNPFSKNKNIVGKHHLDDTESKQALTFPPSLLVEIKHPLKRRSQDFKKHIYQQEINKQQQNKLKQTIGEQEEIYDHRQRGRAVTDYRKASSKIKNLLDKDRIRFQQKQRQQQFKEGFNKYEYSDENQMQESSIHEQAQKEQIRSNRVNYDQNTSNQHYHSSYKVSNPASSSQKESSSKKQFQRSKKEVSSKLQVSNQNNSQNLFNHSLQGDIVINNLPSQKASDKYRLPIEVQQDDEDEVISNSSSFSQFSINGSQKRNIGKISRKSNA